MTTISEFVDSTALDETIVTNCPKYREKFLKIVEKSGVGESDIEDTEAVKKIEKTTSWNWCAFFFSSYWAIYRKEKFGWISLVIGLLLIPLSILVPVLDKPLTAYPYILTIIFGMFGNSYVFRNALKIYPKTTSTVDRAQVSKNGLMISLGVTILFVSGYVYYLSGSEVRGSDLPPCTSDQTKRYHNCFGTYTFADGDKYVGEFRNDKYHGQGTYYYLADNRSKGDKYVGEYKDGKPHGQGTYYHLADNQFKGDKYVGEYKDGKPHGQGTYYYLADNQSKGDKYVGEYKDGKPHGQGTYYHLADNQFKGDKYVGEFKNYKRNGQGTYTYANGTVVEGTWKNDTFQDAQKVTPTRTPEKKADGLTVMSVSDVLLDFRTLIGKRVYVRGFYLFLNEELSFLYEQEGSLTHIIIDAKNLVRADRKILLTQCDGGCTAGFVGVLERRPLGNSLVASKLIK